MKFAIALIYQIFSSITGEELSPEQYYRLPGRYGYDSIIEFLTGSKEYHTPGTPFVERCVGILLTYGRVEISLKEEKMVISNGDVCRLFTNEDEFKLAIAQL